MRSFLAIMFAFSLPLVLINCNKDNVTDSGSSGSDLIEVKIDLQECLLDKLVIVRFNNNVYFKAFLSEHLSSMSGPLATFTTYLPRGTNKCKVFWGGINQSDHSDSTDVYFGRLVKYYIGIGMYSDSLIVKVQETPFIYL